MKAGAVQQVLPRQSGAADALCTVVVGAKACSGPDEASGGPDIETGDAKILRFPFFLDASSSFC
jgi:hypothetical protein